MLFDLVLNTDRLSVDTCVQQIRALLARPEFAETDASRALLQGMALSARVRAALRAHEATHGVDITIEGSDGRSRCAASSPMREKAAAAGGAAVPGVRRSTTSCA